MASVTGTVNLPDPRRAPPVRRRAVSPLLGRILAVNFLALALLVVGLLYLGQYEERLIRSELDALQSEGRIFANALAEGATIYGEDERDSLSPEVSRQMVRRLLEATDVRTQLYGPDGMLMADSRKLSSLGGGIDVVPLAKEIAPAMTLPDVSALLRLLPERMERPAYRETLRPEANDYPEALKALEGDLASQVYRQADGGLLLTVAVPVQRFRQVLGAIVLSRPGNNVASAMRDVRFEILRLFALALIVTTLLSLYLAQGIATPLRRLALAANALRSGQDKKAEIPDFAARGDEIGDLSAALRAMTSDLQERMDAIERFAADVAHELKNPLSSLRSAVETVTKVEDPARRQKLFGIILDDVRRLDRLITDIASASRLDAELSRAEPTPVDLTRMAQIIADLYAESERGRVLLTTVPVLPAMVNGIESRLVQVLQNLIDNALSFSPAGGTVRLAITRDEAQACVTIEDDGPGIPENKREAIFSRFYSERPAGEKFGTHSGLGLSISKQIIDAHRGTIRADNRLTETGEIAGAIFTIRLPLRNLERSE